MNGKASLDDDLIRKIQEGVDLATAELARRGLDPQGKPLKKSKRQQAKSPKDD